VSFEAANVLWQDGLRRLREADPSERPTLERVVDELVVELRRRLGGSFTAAELAELYERESTDWAFQAAVRVAPTTPAAWDMATVLNAAYAVYVRSASDYAGGRRIEEEEGG
jgi:hypothetical protein